MKWVYAFHRFTIHVYWLGNGINLSGREISETIREQIYTLIFSFTHVCHILIVGDAWQVEPSMHFRLSKLYLVFIKKPFFFFLLQTYTPCVLILICLLWLFVLFFISSVVPAMYFVAMIYSLLGKMLTLALNYLFV